MHNKDYIRVLSVDLGSQRIKVEKRHDLMPYIGGVGVAAKLLEEYMHEELPPLDPAQPIILSIGAISTIFPVVTKTAAMFISPLTGEMGESYAGGRLAFSLLHCGIDALVIYGKSEKPIYLSINSSDINFRDARAIWRMDCDRTGDYIRDMEGGGGKRSIIRIGPAGENLCSYAMVNVDSYRHFGRLGLGAVFGSKNLKAIQVSGESTLPAYDFPQYFKTFRDVFKKVNDTGVMKKYHDAGTSVNIEPLNIGGGLPTHNLQAASFAGAANITGEEFANHNLIRKVACVGCPIGCIHIGQFRREFDHGYEYEAVSVSYDYELIFALGSFLGIDSREGILELIQCVEGEGLDAMSTGVCLGWATEALARDEISEKETIVPLKFGNVVNYVRAVEYISKRENDFYRALGDGVRAAAEKYGGYDYAMQIAGNEIAGYHTGYGAVIGALMGARHSHLCNGGYSTDQTMKDFTPDKMADKLYAEEVERNLLNSLTICLFARRVYDRETIRQCLACVGREYNDDELTRAATEIYRTKLNIKKRLGFDPREVRLPQRLFETETMTGKINGETASQIRDIFIEKNMNLLAGAPAPDPVSVSGHSQHRMH